LKFGDVVTCVASIGVIFALIAFPLDLVFFSVLGLGGYSVGLFVSMFLCALIAGYIFAGKLWEARREAITKVSVLWAGLNLLIGLIVPAGLADWGQKAKEEYLTMNPGATLSAAEWVNWEMIVQDLTMFLTVVTALVLGFIGLYVGSMLRKPVKSQK